MISTKHQQISPAAQLMAIEVISELLVSTSPHKLGEALTEHLRELTGARTVMVLAHRPEPDQNELLYASPIRRSTLFSSAELNLFCHEKTPGELPFLPEDLSADHPLHAPLLRAGVHSMARYPLRAGGELVGLLLLFDLPDGERIAETSHIINLLAAPIALALKNALAFRLIEEQAQELELRVEERTTELYAANNKLQVQYEELQVNEEELRSQNNELVATELMLRQSEERHRSILQTAMDGIWLLDPQGRFVEVNETYCRMSGYSMQELLTMSVIDVESLETASDTAAHMQKIMEQGEDRFESQHRRKDGSIYDVEASVQYRPSYGGQFVVFVQDISERKRVEKVLKRAQFTVQHASDALYWITPDARIVDVNEAACISLDYSKDELLRLTVQDIDVLYNAGKWPEHFAELRRCGSLKFESIQRTRDGRQFPVEIVANYIVWGEEEINCAFVRNITERKLAEEEKLKLEAQLHQSQKVESVGRLAGGVAHDFNNMLSVILGHTEIALIRMDQNQPLYSSLLEIRNAAQRSADLTRQLLAFARKQTVAPKVINLNETVAGMLSMLQRLIGENIQLTWKPAQNLWPVMMDCSQVDQIMANLCVNARDAIADVGRISIETGNCSIDKHYCVIHSYASPGEYVKITVSDDGHGMDAETLEHIFEPFFTTKEVGAGTGLGLATVYGIVRQNNGFINVYSEPGTGTTFTIYLPRFQGETEEAQQEGAAVPTRRGHETILLVEDEEAILEITAMILTELGYCLLKANSPGEALQRAYDYSGEIDLLITDVIMPEMNGRDLANNLRSYYPQLKSLFMSGYTADIISHQGVLDEGVQFIQKPFRMNELAAKVREVLDEEQTRLTPPVLPLA